MFSQRYQYSHKRESLQRESIDVPLRTSLWNLFVGIYFKKSSRLAYYPWMLQFTHVLYTEFLARPVVDIPVYSSKVRDELHSFFLNEEWFRIYDLLEFAAAIDSQSRGKRFAWHNPLRQTLAHYSNVLLERHSAAYRFVGYKIQEITDPEELKLLHDSLTTEDDFVRVRLQLRSAFESLTSDNTRNYKTSIVETLRGLDLLSEIVLEKKGVQLGGLIDMLPLDSRLILSLKTLFNHRQESDVVYHPLLEKPNLSFHDTKFFLVMATGLCNYISSFEKNVLAENSLRSQQTSQERMVVTNEHTSSHLPPLEDNHSEKKYLERTTYEKSSPEKNEPLAFEPPPRPPLPPLPPSESFADSLAAKKQKDTFASREPSPSLHAAETFASAATEKPRHSLLPDSSGTSHLRDEPSQDSSSRSELSRGESSQDVSSQGESSQDNSSQGESSSNRPGRWLFSREARKQEEPKNKEDLSSEASKEEDTPPQEMPRRWLNSIFGEGRKENENEKEQNNDIDDIDDIPEGEEDTVEFHSRMRAAIEAVEHAASEQDLSSQEPEEQNDAKTKSESQEPATQKQD